MRTCVKFWWYKISCKKEKQIPHERKEPVRDGFKSVRRALGRVPRRALGRHGLRGVGFGDLREFKSGFNHERHPINSFALTRVRLV